MFGIRKLKADIDFLKNEKAKLFKNDDAFLESFGRLEVSIKTLDKRFDDLEKCITELVTSATEHNHDINVLNGLVQSLDKDIVEMQKKKKPGPKPKKKDGQASESQ